MGGRNRGRVVGELGMMIIMLHVASCTTATTCMRMGKGRANKDENGGRGKGGLQG
jgi:hypothetical protein